jgi:hypothetical protein
MFLDFFIFTNGYELQGFQFKFYVSPHKGIFPREDAGRFWQKKIMVCQPLWLSG